MDAGDEEILKGGRANAGQVLRIGDEVARPTYPQTPSVDHFLAFLATKGVEFAPRALGSDAQGRSRLSFVPGVAPTPPYADWAFDEELLVAVARHQRALHDVAREYTPPVDATWATSAGDYFPAQAFESNELIVCHNDLGMTNTIVDDQHSFAGFIDFDYCCPVDPLFDIAVAARHWVPFGDLDLAASRSLGRVHRFGLFCDAHELSTAQRDRVVSLAIAFLEAARANIQALADAGQVGFQQLLANGYEATNVATVLWIAEHREALASGT